jgi:purine nucleosidase
VLYHIDTDMGVDDGLALFYAFSLLGKSLKTISTVFGNVPLETANRNAALFLRLSTARNDIELWRGAERPHVAEHIDARDVHGDDGLGGATHTLSPKLLSEVESIAKNATAISCVNRNHVLSMMNGSKVTIIALGPATNIEKLIKIYGKSRISRIVIMAGVVFDRGNITEFAEFNAFCDPGALETLVNSGINVTIVPLDVCRKVQLDRSVFYNINGRGNSALLRTVLDSHLHYMENYLLWEGLDGCYPHDTIALLATLAPNRFYKIRANVKISNAGTRRGMMVVEMDKFSKVGIVMGGDLSWIRRFLRLPLGEVAWVTKEDLLLI